MKPVKNRIFCRAVRHTKMLFETQEKAENFIRFNRDEILQSRGKAPCRCYYCFFCMGWHVTSNPSPEEGILLDQRDEALAKDLREKYLKRKEKVSPIPRPKLMRYAFYEQLRLADVHISLFDVEKAECCLSECRRILQEEELEWLKKDSMIVNYQHQCAILDGLRSLLADEDALPDEQLMKSSIYKICANNLSLLKEIDASYKELMELAQAGSPQFPKARHEHVTLIARIKGICKEQLKAGRMERVNEAVEIYQTILNNRKNDEESRILSCATDEREEDDQQDDDQQVDV